MSVQFTTTILLPIILFIIMLGLGLTLKMDDFRRVLNYPRAVVIGLFAQIILLPLAAFALCHIGKLDVAPAIGLMLLAASPGGPTSNLFSKLSHGDVALNLTLTAINSVLSTLTMPLLTGLAIVAFSGAEQNIGFPIYKMLEVAALVLVPVTLGMILNAKRPDLARKLDGPIRKFSVAALVLIILATLGKEWRNLIENFEGVGWAVIVFNILSLAVGYWLPRVFRLPREQAIAVSFEVGIHNSSLALYVALASLGSVAMAVPAAIYSLSMYVTAAAMGYVLARTTAKVPN